MSRKDRDYGASLLGLLAVGGILAWLHHESKKEEEKILLQNEENDRRRKIKCSFDEGITKEEFSNIVSKVTKRIKRIKNVSITETVICGSVESQSGISTWSFLIDFNDYGHLTGKHWVTSDNEESNIPYRVGDMIEQEIKMILLEKGCQISSSASEEKPTVCNDNTKDQPQKKRSSKKKHRFLKFIAILVLFCIASFSAFMYLQSANHIVMPFSTDALIDSNYTTVLSKLTNAGFTNIYLNELNDLEYKSVEKEYLVTAVSIDGDSVFMKGEKHSKDAKVVITYHSLALISAPLTNKDAKGKDYLYVKNAFIDAGFAKIEVTSKPDLILGWFTKEGTVESVKIEGDSKYTLDDTYRPDVEIIITYHTCKSS